MSRFTAAGDRRRSCRGKIRHASYDAAMNAMKVTGEVHGDLRLVVYACSHCDGYHVGHPPAPVQRRLVYDRLLRLIDRANAE